MCRGCASVRLVVLLMPLAKAVFQANDIAHGARPLNEFDPSRRVLGAGFSRRDARSDAVSAHFALRQSDRCATDARRRDVLLHRRASRAVLRRSELQPRKVIHEITHRVYLVVGAVAWLGLAALAATSTDGMVRRLGGNPRWRRLHQIDLRHRAASRSSIISSKRKPT